MKRFVIGMLLIVGVVPVAIEVLEACGAKFLVSRHAARYQRIRKASNPANILIYQAEETDASREFVASVEQSLGKVGHSVAVATGPDSLRGKVRDNEFNIVMMEIEAARSLRMDIESLSPDTAILPVVEFATRAQKSSAKREFGRVLSVPSRFSHVLSVIEDSYAGN